VNDRPSAVELLRAVERFLEHDVVPGLAGPAQFHARVAANVVAAVAREIETEEGHLRGEWERLAALLGEPAPAPGERERLREGVLARTRTLVERIRAGGADAGEWRARVLEHLRRTVADKLEVSRPPRQRVERRS
jgi:hypothetical protein